MTEHSGPAKANSDTKGCPALMVAMVEGLHFDLAKAATLDQGEGLKRAQKRCNNCEAKEQCRGWLDASFGLSLVPPFCPNAPYFLLSAAAQSDT